mmetsp:Transcript_29520/g.49829  ORF Transcript_29520/g.49829 Transcript_29520/m.49829 type:complete len:909 (+) Transcript_29520:331-3057(+)
MPLFQAGTAGAGVTGRSGNVSSTELVELDPAILTADGKDHLEFLQEDFRPSLRHLLGPANQAKDSVSNYVRFLLDHSGIEVYANKRQDICMLAFLEELAGLVGKNHLFKHSLILIRIWWNYETTHYVGTSIHHYLSEFSVCIMVCAIFNRYHSRINSPLQALCLFLAEYATYDGNTQAITLQGIVPFRSPSSSQPQLLEVHPSHLIDRNIIEKYWALFNVNDVDVDAKDYENVLRNNVSNSTSSDDDGDGDGDDDHDDEKVDNSKDQQELEFDDGGKVSRLDRIVSTGSSGSRSPSSPASVEKSAPGGIEKIAMKTLSSHNLHYFDRQLFNVVHPFNHTNMMEEKLSPRRQMRIIKAIQTAATNIQVYLKQKKTNVHQDQDGHQRAEVSAAIAALTEHGNEAEEVNSLNGIVSAGHDPAPTTAATNDAAMMTTATMSGSPKDLWNYFPVIMTRFSTLFQEHELVGNERVASGAVSAVTMENSASILPASAGVLMATGETAAATSPSIANRINSTILYCNMMVEGLLSESAVLELSMELLALKGPIPVGEVGKLLAEVTFIANLSQKLKERFGGLKKFLERFPEYFVISNDHPFNPNVLLRSSLSQEHLDLISRGIFPHQLLMKNKKAAAAMKKKNAQLSSATLPLSSISTATGRGVAADIPAVGLGVIPFSPPFEPPVYQPLQAQQQQQQQQTGFDTTTTTGRSVVSYGSTSTAGSIYGGSTTNSLASSLPNSPEILPRQMPPHAQRFRQVQQPHQSPRMEERNLTATGNGFISSSPTWSPTTEYGIPRHRQFNPRQQQLLSPSSSPQIPLRNLTYQELKQQQQQQQQQRQIGKSPSSDAAAGGMWSRSEDERLKELVASFGRKWTIIGELSIKCHWVHPSTNAIHNFTYCLLLVCLLRFCRMRYNII